MKYGERLKLARINAGLSQEQLAKKAGVGSQVNISKLERFDSTGSEFTVQYAKALGVRPEWLAMGEGEMYPPSYQKAVKIEKALQIMENLPEYALDETIKNVTSLSELIKKAQKASNDGKNS